VNQSPEVSAARISSNRGGREQWLSTGATPAASRAGDPCGKQGYACADNKGEHDGINRKRDGAGAAGDVERIHRGAHQFDRDGGHHAAERECRAARAAYANKGGLAEKGGREFGDGWRRGRERFQFRRGGARRETEMVLLNEETRLRRGAM